MEIVASRKTALLLGATGLVGSELLSQLLKHGAYRRVIAPTRRRLHLDHKKLDNPLISFDNLERYRDIFRCQDVFIALGTTIAKAGSEEAFKRVDYEYVVHAAGLAQAAGANQCLVVSSAGASSNSRFLYSRTKGEMEEAITRLDFWATHVFRPGVLVGNREELRLGEKLAAGLTRAIRSFSPTLLGDYNPTDVDVLAKHMIDSAQTIAPGVHFHGAASLVVA
ncbi:NAD-dependent epimerase/dehydratase family protein [Neolewinella xylanilytica]|uniref:NAD-dependent epimerase/dehydratase family protein n=2 Tax=Neolewinella xylanilytica TaxID=1514080 RepID=A0A2S6I0H3_9BACT|nr:NAD-dependent epimerase/dehydratase family protein [Neolewinella xylanilytica]